MVKGPYHTFILLTPSFSIVRFTSSILKGLSDGARRDEPSAVNVPSKPGPSGVAVNGQLQCSSFFSSTSHTDRCGAC